MNEPNIAVFIQHAAFDRRRANWVRALCTQIQPTLPLMVIEDRTRAGGWPTMRQLWLQAEQCISDGYTHILTIEDDVKLCVDFVAIVPEVIKAVPDHCLSLYTSWPAEKLKPDEHWILRRSGTVAMVMPVGFIPGMIPWIDTHFENTDKTKGYMGARLSLYLTEKLGEEGVWHAVPSLVEHLGGDFSLVGVPKGRKGARELFVDAHDIDWTPKGPPRRVEKLLGPEDFKYYRP